MIGQAVDAMDLLIKLPIRPCFRSELAPICYGLCAQKLNNLA